MRVCYLSDFDMRGSGYQKIGVQVCQALVEYGHTVKAVGLTYSNQPHDFDFSLFSVNDMHEAMGTIQNLYNIYKFDVLIVALDLNIQVRILKELSSKPFKYIGIAPIESDPLLPTWAMWIQTMDKFYAISEFGYDEAKKAGIEMADWIEVGLDPTIWKPPSAEYKKGIRKAFGFDDDSFVVLTVADNQERKNLSGCIKAFSMFAKDHPKARYVIITRENSVVGWDLGDLKTKYGVGNQITIVDRGMEESSLYGWFCAADCHLLLSKAEGLGLPTIEAMASGLIAIGTDCTSTRYLLKDERGMLIPYYLPPDKEPYVDPFGNGYRYMADLNEAAYVLEYLYNNRDTEDVKAIQYRGTEYALALDTKKSTKKLSEWIYENSKK